MAGRKAAVPFEEQKLLYLQYRHRLISNPVLSNPIYKHLSRKLGYRMSPKAIKTCVSRKFERIFGVELPIKPEPKDERENGENDYEYYEDESSMFFYKYKPISRLEFKNLIHLHNFSQAFINEIDVFVNVSQNNSQYQNYDTASDDENDHFKHLADENAHFMAQNYNLNNTYANYYENNDEYKYRTRNSSR